jgi:glyoxylase-like metal-dependent hydrolase (beta-lactamase superfamily II)
MLRASDARSVQAPPPKMARNEMKPNVAAFFHKDTCTISYVVSDPRAKRAAIVDPVLDFDPKSGRTGTRFADTIIAAVRDRGLTVEWILETHAHADHLTAAPYLKHELGGRIGIGAHVTEVQVTFAKLFNLETGFATDGSQFDHLFDADETFAVGEVAGRALHTPGHTPACMTYVIGEAAYVGDTLFMPDFGTARCDFPGGDARTLYRSIQRLLSLPPETRLFMCHDYAPGGRPFRWETGVAEQRAENIHVRDGVDEDEFVRLRSERDATLEMPVLIIPAIQVNIRAGRLPEPEDNGVSYLKLPIDVL